MRTVNRCLQSLVLAAVVAVAPAASGGPPLICHPFTTSDGASLLPWAKGRGWHLPDADYDRTGLLVDTLQLLSADAPVLDRMENMRRAAIYADENPAAAAALLEALVERTKTTTGVRARALAWFDLGYLVETYRQLALVYRHEMRPSHHRWSSLIPQHLDHLAGYALVQQAVALAPELRAELELALALMSEEPMRKTHLASAVSTAAANSVLALNLEHFDER